MTMPRTAAAAGTDEHRYHPGRNGNIPWLDVVGFADHLLLQVDGDVGSEQEQGTVGHVDSAHQPEDQGESGSDDEHQTGKGDSIEECDHKLARLVNRCVGGRAGSEEQHPTDDEHDRQAHAQWQVAADASRSRAFIPPRELRPSPGRFLTLTVRCTSGAVQSRTRGVDPSIGGGAKELRRGASFRAEDERGSLRA